MPRSFEITPTLPTATVDATGKADFAFTVTNALKRAVRAAAEPKLDAEQRPARPEWLAVDEPRIRALQPDETATWHVRVTVPAGTAVGDYGFHLLVSSEENPDDEWTSGPSVSFTVRPTAAPPPPRRPWWLLVVAAAVLLVGGGVTAVLLHARPRQVLVQTKCTAPADCDAREVCAPALDGRYCLYRGGQTCRSDLDCASGWCRGDHRCASETGACSGAPDCRQGFSCVNQICLRDDNQPCTAAQECKSGLCNAGKCAEPQPPSACNCPAGQVCFNGACFWPLRPRPGGEIIQQPSKW